MFLDGKSEFIMRIPSLRKDISGVGHRGYPLHDRVNAGFKVYARGKISSLLRTIFVGERTLITPEAHNKTMSPKKAALFSFLSPRTTRSEEEISVRRG